MPGRKIRLASAMACQPAPAVLSESSIRPELVLQDRIIASLRAMFAILHGLGMFVANLFKLRGRLEAENLFLSLGISTDLSVAR
jgi:hypothetical protein